MTRTPGQPWEDIDAAVARCLAYRDHLDSEQLGSMAYDAILRNLRQLIVLRCNKVVLEENQ